MADGTPRIGLVLGAGGVAGGAFHAGVLAALSEVTGWDPRQAAVIVGTSAGSITGASLRAGLPAADLLARAQDRPLSAEGERVLERVGPFRPPPSMRATRQSRPPAELAATLARAARRPLAARPWSLAAALLPDGSISTDMISDGISGLFPDLWPTDPLWICAVRQADGRRVVFGRDAEPPVADAVAASCAIAGFFSPVLVDGEAHIDGGVHSPTNADVLAASPFDLVLVSSPMSRQGRRPRLAADQAMRAFSGALLDAEAVRLRRRRIPVMAFQPDAAVLTEMGLNAMDPERRSAIAAQARTSALRKLARADVAARLAPLAP
jgi:NTE family protein